MVDLFVDVDALSELSRQLQQVQSALENTNTDVNRSVEACGSQRLADAIGDFVDGWEDGRKHLCADVGSLLAKIEDAVQAYQEQEAQLTKAVKAVTQPSS